MYIAYRVPVMTRYYRLDYNNNQNLRTACVGLVNNSETLA